MVSAVEENRAGLKYGMPELGCNVKYSTHLTERKYLSKDLMEVELGEQSRWLSGESSFQEWWQGQSF